MRGLILGQSPQNAEIHAFFTKHGYTVHTEEDPFALRRLRGQVGDFEATLPDGKTHFDFVVVTQPPTPPPPVLGGGTAQSLTQAGKEADCGRLPPHGTVAFLLDHEAESTLAATVRTLTDAAALARQKRDVVVFDKYVRTAGHGVETLYLQAREAGVTFRRYRELNVRFNPGTGVFSLHCDDGFLHTGTEAARLYADGGRELNDAFRHCLDVLRLWPDTEGRLPDERFFLLSVRSSRRGIFLIGQDLAAERLTDGLRYIAAAMDTHRLPFDKSQNTAVVDGEKCALCNTCYRACPHAALQPGADARRMECLPLACEGCGNCVPVCPGGALRLSEAPAETESQNQKTILALCCENSAALVLPEVLAQLAQEEETKQLAVQIEVRSVPCGGNIGLEDITKALLQYDRVLVATCMDSACRHFEGSHRAKLQCTRLKDLLDGMQLPAHRVGTIQTSHAMPGVLRDKLLHFLEDY